jgi:hypothetical protein
MTTSSMVPCSGAVTYIEHAGLQPQPYSPVISCLRGGQTFAETDYLPLMKLFAETLVIVNGELTQMFFAGCNRPGQLLPTDPR